MAMQAEEAGYMDWNPPLVRVPDVTVSDVHRYATARHKMTRSQVAAVEAAMELDPSLRGLAAEMARDAGVMPEPEGFVPRRFGHLLLVADNT